MRCLMAVASERPWRTTGGFIFRPRAASIAGASAATIRAARLRRRSSRGPPPDPPTQLQVIPSEVLLHPGERASFRVRSLDANGSHRPGLHSRRNEVKWASYVPPTARVKSAIKGAFDDAGPAGCRPRPTRFASAGAFEATVGPLKGYIRGRVMANVPYKEDFESFTLSQTNATGNSLCLSAAAVDRREIQIRRAGARRRARCCSKTTDNRFFQRATVFIGTPDMSGYTIQADVMSEGNRRKMSEVGVINQRYLIVLKGNEQKLEVNSNQERLRVGRDFKWSPNAWYRLKARVDRNPDGSTCGARQGVETRGRPSRRRGP